MGYGHWSSADYSHLRTEYAGRSRDDIFKQNQVGAVSPAMDPHGLTYRESRDSVEHPNSLAIGVFLDVTGSMGRIPEALIRHKLGDLMDTLLDHQIEDPQIMFSAIGDHHSDRAPLQVGQFESSTDSINAGLSNIYMEGGGGGQNMESYLLAWLVAGLHTEIDCWEKRQQKGFLFTVGDEKNWDSLDARALKSLMGYSETKTWYAGELLAAAQAKYHVFHIHINETGYRDNPEVLGYWRHLLGERLLILDDHQALAELIASTIALVHGIKPEQVFKRFGGGVARQVRKALGMG